MRRKTARFSPQRWCCWKGKCGAWRPSVTAPVKYQIKSWLNSLFKKCRVLWQLLLSDIFQTIRRFLQWWTALWVSREFFYGDFQLKITIPSHLSILYKLVILLHEPVRLTMAVGAFTGKLHPESVWFELNKISVWKYPVSILMRKVPVSGDSRKKKLVRPLRGQGRKYGGQYKCLSCMVIFRSNEDWFAMINPIKHNIGLWISSESSPESLQIV